MFEKVRDFISEKLSIEKGIISTDTELAQLGVDSIQIMTMIMEFEEEFGVTVEDRELEQLHTIDDIVKLAEKDS